VADGGATAVVEVTMRRKSFSVSQALELLAVIFFVLFVIALARTPVNQDPVGDLPPVDWRP
jgi:hypothetical protein